MKRYVKPSHRKPQNIADKNLKFFENILCMWFGRFIIIKMPILPQSIYKLNMISIKFPEGLLGETGKMTL